MYVGFRTSATGWWPAAASWGMRCRAILPLPPTMAIWLMPPTYVGSTRVQAVQFRTFAIAMPTRFRGINRREGMLLKGEAGWAEFSPFLGYDDTACVPWLAAAIDSAERPWPEPVRDLIPVNCTVPAVGPEHAADIVRRSGLHHGQGQGGRARPGARRRPAARRGRARRHRAVRPGAHRRQRRVVGRRRPHRDQHARRGRQPRVRRAAVCHRRGAGRSCGSSIDVPIAADESIRHSDDPLRVAQLEAADIAVLKVQPLGGVHACLEIAEKIGLPVVVSSAVETSVGLAAGLALAAALPELPYACGLGTTSLLDGDVVTSPLVPSTGTCRSAASTSTRRRSTPSPRTTRPSPAGRHDSRRCGRRANESADERAPASEPWAPHRGAADPWLFSAVVPR